LKTPELTPKALEMVAKLEAREQKGKETVARLLEQAAEKAREERDKPSPYSKPAPAPHKPMKRIGVGRPGLKYRPMGMSGPAF